MGILQRLHDSEINASIASFFDGAWTVKLGDEMNGFRAEEVVASETAGLSWLDDKARELYPLSAYATAEKADDSPTLPADFFWRAQEFFTAYQALPLTFDMKFPRQYLATLAVELWLKAYLLSRGLPALRLERKYGHDLERLYGRAKREGLVASADRLIEAISETHMAHEARYPPWLNPMASVQQFEPEIRDLAAAVGAAVFGHAMNSPGATPGT